MNKSKKINAAVVATVMAGSLVVPLAACHNGDNGKKDVIVNADANGKLIYAKDTVVKTSMGYNSAATGITYTSEYIGKVGSSTASSMVLAGHRYTQNDLKPAWQALSENLGIKVDDDWVDKGNNSAGDNIKEIKNKDGLASYGLITASAVKIVEESSSNAWLNLTEYLDYMPNYKAFLEANPVVRLSLTANTSNGAMYMVPYFDGNDDIEKYVLMRKDIVEKLLDTEDVSAATGTFASQATAKNAATNKGVVTVVGTSASVQPFMGNVAADNYKIAVTDPSALTGTPEIGKNKSQVIEADKMKTVELTVDYGAVITALGDNASDLYKAVEKALPTGTAVQKTSGNIVAIQNQIINATNGQCTGAQLLTVLKEYIKVAYHKTGETAAFYTVPSEVFNSAYAAWDVDLYVALGRAAMCSSALLGASSKGENAYFLGSRVGTTNRTYDIASMAGELYGVRGLTSRYTSLYAYIDNEGNIKDARNDAAYWDALDNMSKLAKEGLYYTGQDGKDGKASIANDKSNTNIQFYSSTDYVQTQTKEGGFATSNIEEGYNYAPILTPVSRWDVDGKSENGNEVVMRFTESWRGVKDGGLAVPIDYVRGNSDRLGAVLTIIDYMFSNDGGMILTYGPFSKAGNIDRTKGATENVDYGTWYGEPVTNVTWEKAVSDKIVDTNDGEMYYVTEAYQGQYFCYGNKLYTGTYYNGKMVPTMTDESKTLFNDSNIGNHNFTNYARQFLGSALNFGNKDQGFEYQCTAKCGIVGSDIWAIANVNGTIKHTLQTIDSSNWWYTLVPTTLPFTSRQITAMSDQYKTVSGYGDAANSNFFYANSKATGNILTDYMYYGYAAEGQALTGMTSYTIQPDANGAINMLTDSKVGMEVVDGYLTQAWNSLKTYYTTLTANNK